jgi:hypothetical protein
MVSKELQILIESIKVVLLDGSKKHIENLCNDASIDWDKVDKMLKYHRIRPVFYEAMRRINIQNKVVESAGRFSKIQAIKNLNEIQESKRVLLLLKAANIPVVPYKGILFLEKLYQNNALREIGDLDILVKPEDAVEAMKVLVADGYELAIEGEANEEMFKQIVDTFPSPEVSFDKVSPLGMNVQIDFHWGMNESELYEINSNSVFEETEMGLYQKTELLIPTNESIFKMLLNHHGGRECWVRLKDLADLIALKKSFTDFSELKLDELAAAVNMQRINAAGNDLLDLFLYDKNKTISEYKDAVALQRIVYMWEYAVHWDALKPKVILLTIYRRLQDKETSWLELLNMKAKYYSQANLKEEKRLFYLPEKYVKTNAFLKLMTYLNSHYIQPIFKKK